MERTKRAKSSKAAARDAVRAQIMAKKKGSVSGLSRMDEVEIADEGLVYDEVNEEEYEKLVNARREREDFVVDDDGLGYHDDGEEYFGERDEDGKKEAVKVKRGINASLDEGALKKARMLNEQSKGEEEGGGSSMLGFVRMGGKGEGEKLGQRKVNLGASLDSMLSTSTLTTKKKGSKKANSKKAGAAKKAKAPKKKKVTVAFEDFAQEGDSTAQASGMDLNGSDDAGNDNFGMNDDYDDLPDRSGSSPENKRLSFSSATTDEEKTTAVRSRFKNTKRASVSKATSAALEAGAKTNTVVSSTAQSAAALPNISTNVTPVDISSTDAPASAAQQAAAAANLSNVVSTDSKGEPVLKMFWLDAWEKKGVVYVFGKVLTNSSTTTKPVYVSCCVTVHNNMRNMFCLPRVNQETGERVNMMEVHKDMKKIIDRVLPKQSGASWAGKPVKRKYAFEVEDVPRGECDYLKVKYPASFPAPPQEICKEGTENIQRIFGGNTSPLETFVIKRGLMGPCWIDIRGFTASTANLSHCKIEVNVQNPKNIKRGEDAPAPPVVTMTLKMKTVVNPKSHKSEIVSLCAVCNRDGDIEGGGVSSASSMQQLSLVRPLGLAASEGVMNTFPHDLDNEIRSVMPQLKKNPNERAMISRFMAQVGAWDPDVIVGHNAWGFDVEVLLSRCKELKVNTWDRLGRLKRSTFPGHGRFENGVKDWVIAECLTGRVLCDTYISSKELLRETTYSLTNLSATQLKVKRVEIEPQDIPVWFNASKNIVQLCQHTLMDCQLVGRLLDKLQVLPLTRQLTNISGNCWARTMKGNRAERTDYLLLHEFRKLKYICPDKQTYDNSDSSGGGKKREKAKYSGGLVLEPKKGLYDTFILLLDFNSLYPSIIQEYNLCHTTMNWSGHHAKMMQDKAASGVRSNINGEDDDDDDEVVEDVGNDLPPIPDESLDTGVLPRVIRTIIQRRGVVKKMLKEKNLGAEKKKELDIRQKALKLTANSMYGCLGFSFSRFYAQPIAALITAMGREALQRCVDVTSETVGLEVIYGDTDSIMINTMMSGEDKYDQVFALGEKVKREVNKLYKTMELEIDGVFKSMLLLKKKKYAAVTVEKKDGKLVEEKEMKGLDLVRRDWCIQSKDSGRLVLDHVLSGNETELVVNEIHSHLEALANKMRANELPLDKYVITKGLSKHPNEYPDSKSLPHVGVAKRMLKNKKPVNVGDHIPYVICKEPEVKAEEGKPIVRKSGGKKSVVDRAYHPEEVVRSNGELVVDVEWYLTQQILPPIARLCEPIDGTSSQIMAEKMGLDSSRFRAIRGGDEGDDNLGFVPLSKMADSERFGNVEKLEVKCKSCGEKNVFQGVLDNKWLGEKNQMRSGLCCPNPKCVNPNLWGEMDHFACFNKISNALQLKVKGMVSKYYEGELRCDDISCGMQTRQLSVCGGSCLARGCHGKMVNVFGENDLWTTLTYHSTLFDLDHGMKEGERVVKGEDRDFNKRAAMQSLGEHDKKTFEMLKGVADTMLDGSAYNFVRPSLFSMFFQQAGQ